MIANPTFLDKFLQKYRFKMVEPYLIGDVLDFGGNKGELKKLVKGKYLVVNYDHSIMENTHFDTIVCLAVIEHIKVKEVFKIFEKFKKILNKKGRICLTTPTKLAKPILELLASKGMIDRRSIAEHKHYWNKREICALAKKTGFAVKKYKKFQRGLNQFAIFEHG